jgi:RNA polymerase subunit RPABC4/transcription elongation factor Spt4
MTGRKKKKEHLCCPYCDVEIMEANFPYCQACQVTVFYCLRCRKPLPRENRVCPHCGAEIKG